MAVTARRQGPEPPPRRSTARDRGRPRPARSTRTAWVREKIGDDCGGPIEIRILAAVAATGRIGEEPTLRETDWRAETPRCEEALGSGAQVSEQTPARVQKAAVNNQHGGKRIVSRMPQRTGNRPPQFPGTRPTQPAPRGSISPETGQERASKQESVIPLPGAQKVPTEYLRGAAPLPPDQAFTSWADLGITNEVAKTKTAPWRLPARRPAAVFRAGHRLLQTIEIVVSTPEAEGRNREDIVA